LAKYPNTEIEVGLQPKLNKPGAVELARGASYVIIQNMISWAAILVSFPIIARLLTPREMGIWTILLFVNQLGQTIATLGLPGAVTKYVAELISQGKDDAAGAAFYQAMRTLLFLSCALALAVFAEAGTLSVQLMGQRAYAPLFQVLALDMVVYAGPLPVLVTAMYGLQKFREAASVGVVATLMQQTLVIALLLLLRSIVGLVLAWVITDIAAVAMYLAYVSRALGTPRFDFPLKKLLSFSWPLSVSYGISFASTWFDRALLAILFPLATLGVYNATITAFGALVSICTAMAGVLLPAYSARQSGKPDRNLGVAVRQASRYLSLTAVPLALGLAVTGKPALTLFAGEAYVGGVQPLVILTVIFAITLFGAALSPVLLALGETRQASLIGLLSVAISLGAASLLLPLWRMSGAAVSRGFSMITATALTFYVLHRKIELRLDFETIAKSLVAGTIMAIVLVTVQIWLYSKFLLPIYMLVGVITYLLALRELRAVRQEDIELTRSYFGRRLAFLAGILGRILT
jgi:O-antigen/teichoic acid export membrane protein